jgi:hypothetical protein
MSFVNVKNEKLISNHKYMRKMVAAKGLLNSKAKFDYSKHLKTSNTGIQRHSYATYRQIQKRVSPTCTNYCFKIN